LRDVFNNRQEIILRKEWSVCSFDATPSQGNAFSEILEFPVFKRDDFIGTDPARCRGFLVLILFENG
jgi:hypothetical protein